MRYLPAMVAVALLAIVSPVSARFNSPTLLFDTPTADVLPAGALAISADATYPLTKTRQNVDYVEFDANVRYSPFKHLDFAVTAYTFTDYVLEAKYQILGGDPGRFGLAVGVYDVGFHDYVSPIGHGPDDAWPDWKYWTKDGTEYIRPYERFSAFVVTSIPVTKFARVHVGVGRGRFAGYDGPNEYLNTDIFFEEYNQWAIALFGGLEVYVNPHVAVVAEANNRDMNTGIKANFGPFSAAVAWTKMEGLINAKGTEGDETFGRLEVGISYQVDRYIAPEIPLYRVAPAPERRPVAAPSKEKLRLYPIWFRWDKWDITEVAAATLRRNAKEILAHPDMKVEITGYASEEGTVQHNFMLSGRRAYAAFQYLLALGVPGRQMRFHPMGESAGRSLPLHRAVYFEIELEK